VRQSISTVSHRRPGTAIWREQTNVRLSAQELRRQEALSGFGQLDRRYPRRLMDIYAAGGGIYTIVGIAGYVAGALLVVGIFVTQRVRRTAKISRLDDGGAPDEREES
jgi:hypothetical protein